MASTNKAGSWLSKKKSYCVITGASRGLGKTLALKFAPYFGAKSVLVLLARNRTELEKVKVELKTTSPDVEVVVCEVDLGKPNLKDFTNIIQSSFAETNSKPTDFEQAIIIHNAASMGKFALVRDMGDPEEWAQYFALNVNSAACLNSAFLNTFQPYDAIPKLVINITSLSAVRPILSAGFYNTGKAAREVLFRTLAMEEPGITVLSYSPGPLDTDMFHDASQKLVHPGGIEHVKAIVAAGKVLSCETTTNKLLDILGKRSFTSGDRLDYYDR